MPHLCTFELLQHLRCEEGDPDELKHHALSIMGVSKRNKETCFYLPNIALAGPLSSGSGRA